MADTKKAPFPLMKIAAFVDATTACVAGDGVNQLKEDEELYVLGVGFSMVPIANVPLVVPKTTLEVTMAAGPYVLAKAPIIETTSGGNFAAFDVVMPKTVRRRPVLTDQETAFLGNPGKEKLMVGDTVIRKVDLQKYISYRMDEMGQVNQS